MKNLQLFKRGISLLTTSVVLVSLVGCRKNSNKSVELEENKDLCHHFSVRVGDEYETYKECDGYDLDITVGGQTGTCYFEISRDDNLLLEGTTMEYTQFTINHNNYYDENVAFQKVKGK